MAAKATIFKADLNISDVDRGYYGAHALTVARHPSETDLRMMVRLLAFALHADPALQFTRGLSTDDEPDLWRKSLTDEIELWIDVGLPDERRIRKACGRSQEVVIYAYGARTVGPWWEALKGSLDRFDNLTVYEIPAPVAEALAAMAQRAMDLQCLIQDGQPWISDGTDAMDATRTLLFPVGS